VNVVWVVGNSFVFVVESVTFFVVRTVPPGTFYAVVICCVVTAGSDYDGEQTLAVDSDVSVVEISGLYGVETTATCFSCQYQSYRYTSIRLNPLGLNLISIHSC